MRNSAARKLERQGEAGIALVLAILALMLLTFLGLTLAATTSTEMTIAANYRLAQQALYNAEAGAELAKTYLRDVDWALVLPPVRNYNWKEDDANFMAPAPPQTRATRNCENGNQGCPQVNALTGCDLSGGQAGFGVVYDDGNFIAQDVDNYQGFKLNGTFTIWIRRATKPCDDLTIHDYSTTRGSCNLGAGVVPDVDYRGETGQAPFLPLATDGILILTSEGTAGVGANRARRLIELTLTRVPALNKGFCGTRGGQAGGGQGGAGFGSCVPIDDAQGVAEIDPNRK